MSTGAACKVGVSVTGSTARGHHRPQTLGPVKTSIFNEGKVTTVSLKKQSRRVDGGLTQGRLSRDVL